MAMRSALSGRAVERGLLLLLALGGAAAMVAAPGLGLWDANGPSSGFLPALAGGMVVLCALACLLRPEASARTPFIADAPGARRVGAVLATLVALAAGIPWLGFAATAVPAIALLLIAINRGRVLHALLVAIGATLAIHLLFETLLETLLPRGVLGLG